MKRIFSFFVLLLAVNSLFSQAYEAKLEHQRKMYVAAVIELPYPASELEDAIQDYMAKKGFKVSSSKNVLSFKGVKLNPNNTENNDIHFKVERKSRKEKEVSLVHLVVSKENETLTQRIPEDLLGLEDGKSFLNAMTPAMEAYHLEMEIIEQDKVIKKAEKKFENLEDDQKDLEKKIKNLEDKLEQNKKDQATQKTEVSNQKNILEGLKAKRKS
ncbi:MAG: hypothetical protein ACKVOW_11590 [Chitinophagaceae bacterium]